MYQITDWNTIYENAHTRKLKTLHWVPTPNKHDGEGFGRIFLEPDGCALYGAWHLILQVGSKCQPRGRLCRRDGTPLDARAIALKTRAPEEIIERALEFFSSPEVGWLQVLTDPLADSPNALAKSGAEGKGMEWKGINTHTRAHAREETTGLQNWVNVACGLCQKPLPSEEAFRDYCLAWAKVCAERYGDTTQVANDVLAPLKTPTIRWPSQLLYAAGKAVGKAMPMDAQTETVEQQAARMLGEKAD